jgi:single-stranded DNA-binding protein
MTSYNRVILTGRVATPPRCHYRPDGSPVIQFPLELDDTKDLSGQKRPQDSRKPPLNRADSGHAPNRTGSVGLINIVATGKLAEFKPDLQSGQRLLVVGKLNQRSWKTPEGKNRTRTEVIATDLRTMKEIKPDTCPSIGEMDPMKRGEEHEETG